MAKMKSRTESNVVLFDVYYEDGGRASNRKVPATELGGLDGDEPALGILIAQEQKISDLSGKPLRAIDRIERSGRKAPVSLARRNSASPQGRRD
jgi:hypothetical protein